MISSRLIHILQIVSLSLIWVFVLAITLWILSLLRVARELDDAISASVAIGVVAIPLFLTLASILTYVFVGLRKYRGQRNSVPGKEMRN